MSDREKNRGTDRGWSIDSFASTEIETSGERRRTRGRALAVLAAIAGILLLLLIGAVALLVGARFALLIAIGLGLGMTLEGFGFGFAGPWRALIQRREAGGVLAQILAIALTATVAIPLIAAHPGELSGAAAPIGWAMLGGAFVFGVAMQVVLGCGSGTLVNAGSGNAVAVVALPFFILGSFLCGRYARRFALTTTVIAGRLVACAGLAAGLGLGAFSAGMLSMYFRNPEMTQDDGIRPSDAGKAIAKDSWLVGIGLASVLMAAGNAWAADYLPTLVLDVPGTALLLETLPPLSGRGADLGCGLGILARAVLASEAVTALTLLDIDLEKLRILASWSSEHSDPSVTNAAANQPPTATP